MEQLNKGDMIAKDDLPTSIMASMMCANLLNLESETALLEAANIDFLHFDLMDNNFVPNLALSPDIITSVRSITNLPFDIHLMVNRPENLIDQLDLRPGDYVSIHLGSTPHPQRLLNKLRKRELKTSVALSPSTPIYQIEELLPDLDMILLMTVNPGFAGQKLIPQSIQKISRLRNFLNCTGYKNIGIEVDGNVSFENAKIMRAAGANLFVAGSSSIFHPSVSILNGVSKLRKLIK